MANFFDQDNPLASEIRADADNMVKYERQASNLSNNSRSSYTKRERVSTKKGKMSKKEKQRRLGSLVAACMIFGGVAVTGINELVEVLEDNSIVYSQTSEFKDNIINPNTHRTYDNQGYYYDYDNIAMAIKEDGKDFSQELYKSYVVIGEEQTNRVLEYTNYDSVKEYARHAGFESVDAWMKSEKKKIILEEKTNDNKTELDAMYSELNQSSKSSDANYTGGK